jgi:hypothetical protein
VSADLEQSKTLQRLAQKRDAGNLDAAHKEVLDATHTFKLGWAVLGQTLLKVQRSKAYREWGFSDFKTFCAKELGLRYSTVEKLLRSTYYMQRHEPRWLDRNEAIQVETPTPDLNAVNFLARGEEQQVLGGELAQNLHKEVFESGATGIKVGRMAAAELDQTGRDALGLKPPPPEDPVVRSAQTATRDVAKVVRGLKKVEAPNDVQSSAGALLDGVRRWQNSLEESS